ncbi:hypothetical protein BH24ACT3_BH24ACT3_14290 [soil metagenome]
MSDLPPPPEQPTADQPPPAQGTGGYPPPAPGAYGQPAGGWAQGGRGAVGEPRAVGKTILLSIVTCGIWTILWTYWNHEELKRYRNDGLGGGLGVVIYIFASPVTWFLMASEVEKMYQEEGQESPVNTMIGLWFLLPIIGNIIWYTKMQEALNDFWMARGAPAPQ